ncbi:hypothetical protein F3Y22_tig00113725pilonHSYRG00062 [Hibiscus syriacus]|uniref:Uncharacterized protein n=1 Tax=Hibiscus syriacus TaxID=106335 RepID=A0A6A2WME8_HIBSY|nr:hypothetical protein F3Y22_tig00113725pilonHSYRG00062 [Hibiscus syriacus]
MPLNKPMAAISPSLVPSLLFARISGILVAALVLSWALLFKSSFLPHSPVSSQEDPILLYIGTQMVACFEEFEERRAFVASRGGFRLRGFWDLDEVPWATRHCG